MGGAVLRGLLRPCRTSAATGLRPLNDEEAGALCKKVPSGELVVLSRVPIPSTRRRKSFNPSALPMRRTTMSIFDRMLRYSCDNPSPTTAGSANILNCRPEGIQRQGMPYPLRTRSSYSQVKIPAITLQPLAQIKLRAPLACAPAVKIRPRVEAERVPVQSAGSQLKSPRTPGGCEPRVWPLAEGAFRHPCEASAGFRTDLTNLYQCLVRLALWRATE